MAYTKKNSTKTIDNSDINVVKEVTEQVEEVIEQKVTNKVEKKKFSQTDMIPCVSITAGELFYVGNKSQTLYTFADINDVQEIEFRDLDYAARTKDKMMFKPRFIVQDADFVALHPSLDEVYSSLHSTKDLKDILKMSPIQMENAIYSLPIGAQDALKAIAATMVDNGTLDSVKRIQTLDSIFGTELLLKLNM